MGQWLEPPAPSSQSPDLVHATPADTTLVLGVSGWDWAGGLMVDVAQRWAFLQQIQSSKLNSARGKRSWCPVNGECQALESEPILVLGRTCKGLEICHVFW